MAFSIAGLITNGKTHLDDEKCIEFSCPEFFTLLKELIN
jgi:5-enolpyruvylshikimate-3-phosphate synthase